MTDYSPWDLSALDRYVSIGKVKSTQEREGLIELIGRQGDYIVELQLAAHELEVQNQTLKEALEALIGQVNRRSITRKKSPLEELIKTPCQN